MLINNRNILLLIGALSLGVVSLSAHAAADADSLQQVVDKGKELFMTASFNGNGRHCTTCHKGGGLEMSELPNGKKFPSLSNAASIFPRYIAKQHLVRTLPDQVQHCVRNAIEGKPPAFDSAEMTELVSYLTSLSQGKPMNMDGKPQ